MRRNSDDSDARLSPLPVRRNGDDAEARSGPSPVSNATSSPGSLVHTMPRTLIPGDEEAEVGEEEPLALLTSSLPVSHAITPSGNSGMEPRSSRNYNASIFGRVAESQWFENTTFVVIAVNSVWLAVDVDLNPAAVVTKADWPFQVAEYSFSSYFSLEWLVKVLGFRDKRAGFKDPWFLFDTLLLALMLFESVVIPIFAAFAAGAAGNNVGTLALLRLLRLMRLTRITRLMRMLPEMMIMLKGMVSASRTVIITGVLLVIMTYVFAILFVQLTSDASVKDTYFKNVRRAMYELIVGSILADQGDTITDLVEGQWYFGAIFCFFVAIVTFTMMNMLVGVLCEVACRVSAIENKKMEIELLSSRLEDLLEDEIDENGDKHISKAELLGISHDCTFVAALRKVGVDIGILIDHADFIFDTVDVEGEVHEHTLDFPSFMQVILRLRESNIATVRDLTVLKKELRDSFADFATSPLSRPPSPHKSPQKSDEPERVEEPKLGAAPPPIAQWQPPRELRALAGLSEEVVELKGHADRLEGLMEQVLQGQLQVQAVVREGLPPVGSEPAAAGGGRSSQASAWRQSLDRQDGRKAAGGTDALLGGSFSPSRLE